MNRLGILHITDLHHDSGTPEPVGLVKDEAVSPYLVNELTFKDCFSFFLTRIQTALGKNPLHALAFSGDIGWGKDPGTLGAGIQKLRVLKDRLSLKSQNVLIAPGNHDLSREADPGRELDAFVAACNAEGFTCAQARQPVLILIQNIPIIVLNTCLGGTEHAVHGEPPTFWQDVRAALRTLLSGRPDEDLLDAMDIPAVGNTQLEVVGKHLGKQSGNCIVIVGHHPPLPTHNVEVRPYATLVDSGQVIFQLIANGHRIVYLHGHSHCNSSLVAHSPESMHDGFFACIGDRGLHGAEGATATYVQVIVDNNGNFGAALVYRYQKNGASLTSSAQFPLWDVFARDNRTAFDISRLDVNRRISFADAYKVLRQEGPHSEDDLAFDFSRHFSQRQISITNLESPPQDWTITRHK